MENLTELNLRRNEIVSVHSMEKLVFMQRIYLSFNVIKRYEDIWCVGECTSLVELALDGNPFTEHNNYRQTVLASSSKIKMLDGKRVTVSMR
jgi:Leucine-rich repeat (LRR) protein